MATEMMCDCGYRKIVGHQTSEKFCSWADEQKWLWLCTVPNHDSPGRYSMYYLSPVGKVYWIRFQNDKFAGYEIVPALA